MQSIIRLGQYIDPSAARPKKVGWTSSLGELAQLEFSISKKLGQVALLLGQVAKLGWPR